MLMPGRKYSSGKYRYGFNGQEKTSEILENTFNAEFWEYDSRSARRWNVDPILKDDESPFMTIGNNPIVMVDPTGADWYKNKASGGYEWHEGSGRIKGLRHMKTGTWSKRNKDGFSYFFGNSQDGLIQDGPSSLAEVVVVAKRKTKGGRNWLNLPSYSKKDVSRWESYHAMLRDRHNLNQLLMQDSDPQEFKEQFNFYQRTWQASEDWRSANYAILDAATLIIPVPKLGMARWFRPFGNSAGRVFWSGGGITGKAFTSATEYALLHGGTTLEMTTAGKILTKITMNKKNWLTGKIWEFGSRQFAKGASGEIHVFIDLSRASSESFWFNHELPILTSKGLDILTHIR